ncbi:MAG: VWD domain-containing protein [Cyanobacteria bacterium J06643_5]
MKISRIFSFLSVVVISFITILVIFPILSNTYAQESCQVTNVANKQGKSYGDPHILTFDGHRYSFQTVGEFILVKHKTCEFEVQVRQAPVNTSLSLNSAVAMRVGSNRVGLYAQDFPDSDTTNPLRINGKPATVKGKSLSLSGGGKIYRNGNNYVVEWSTGEKLIARIYQSGKFNYMDISVFVSDSQSNQVIGLLGNANGNPKDDLRFRNGKKLPSKSTYGDVNNLVNRVSPVRLPLNRAMNSYLKKLNKDFGNSWRISQEESLFDYAANQSTNTFSNRKFPAEYLTLGRLSTSELQSAQATCRQQNVEPELMEGCIFDVAYSGNRDFARTAAKAGEMINLLEDLGIPNPLRKVVPNPVRDVIKKVPGLPRLPF